MSAPLVGAIDDDSASVGRELARRYLEFRETYEHCLGHNRADRASSAMAALSGESKAGGTAVRAAFLAAVDLRHAGTVLDECARCGRVWCVSWPSGSVCEETANPNSAGPCSGCGGGGYVPPAVKPRSLDCPTCGRKGVLTAREASKGYHCRDCTEIAEFGVY